MDTLCISDNIVRLRHEKKITQEQLADFIGVTKASVSKWENRQSTPDIMILPQLAAYFDVTVDELLGYTPQLSKEQIQYLYQKFCKDFSRRPFEEVMEETRKYVKRYYSCYPFLLQISILWVNHATLTENQERQQEIWDEVGSLCERIKSNCKEIRIHSNAVVIQALAYMQTGRVGEVVEELEDIALSDRMGSQINAILARAYTSLREQEKANGLIQVSMYDNVMNLMANGASYLMLHGDQADVCEETVRRIERVAEEYHIMELNPNNLASFEYLAANCYLAQGEREKALSHLETYARCLERLFKEPELRLHGDAYFDRMEEWFDQELDNGTNAPRSREIVLEDVKKTLDIPAFASLQGDAEFEHIRQRVKELS